jgi:hypothetical protein
VGNFLRNEGSTLLYFTHHHLDGRSTPGHRIPAQIDHVRWLARGLLRLTQHAPGATWIRAVLRAPPACSCSLREARAAEREETRQGSCDRTLRLLLALLPEQGRHLPLGENVVRASVHHGWLCVPLGPSAFVEHITSMVSSSNAAGPALQPMMTCKVLSARPLCFLQLHGYATLTDYVTF